MNVEILAVKVGYYTLRQAMLVHRLKDGIDGVLTEFVVTTHTYAQAGAKVRDIFVEAVVEDKNGNVYQDDPKNWRPVGARVSRPEGIIECTCGEMRYHWHKKDCPVYIYYQSELKK